MCSRRGDNRPRRAEAPATCASDLRRHAKVGAIAASPRMSRSKDRHPRALHHAHHDQRTCWTAQSRRPAARMVKARCARTNRAATTPSRYTLDVPGADRLYRFRGPSPGAPERAFQPAHRDLRVRSVPSARMTHRPLPRLHVQSCCTRHATFAADLTGRDWQWPGLVATAGQSSAEDLRTALAFAAAMSLSKLNVEKPTPSVERGNDLDLDQQVWVDQRGHADHG